MPAYETFVSNGQQQCRWCRQIIRMIPYPAQPGKAQRWGAFVDAYPITLEDPMPSDKPAYVLAPDGKSVIGPYKKLANKIAVVVPHDCPNRN